MDNEPTSALVGDGYEITGRIRGVPRLYPSTTITYRPMTRTEINAQSKSIIDSTDEVLQEKLASQAVAKHLKVWNLTDRSGATLPINEKTLLNLQARLFQRLYAIIMGREPVDEFVDNEAAADEGAAKN